MGAAMMETWMLGNTESLVVMVTRSSRNSE